MILARGQITITNEADILDSIKVGGRNLVPNGKGTYILRGDPDKFANRAYRRTPNVSISSDKSYCMGAYIEVIEGSPHAISAISYKYESRTLVHNPARALYDQSKGGKQWLTWIFLASDRERVEMDAIRIYAGEMGKTQGITIHISDVILIEGNIPPTSWIPAPEDVEDKAKELARIESARTLREQVSIERDRAYETYRKLRTDSRTPKDKGLALEQTWITANGAHANLYQSCNTFITTPTDANFGVIERRTREYKSAMASLQRSIQEVEQAIREQFAKEAKAHADDKARQEAEARTQLAKGLQTADERIASLDYLKAIIAKGKREPQRIKDGAVIVPLLLNNYIGILDEQNKLRATLSGDTKGGLFLSAGISDQGYPNVEIMHRGEARFGQIYIYPDGRIEVKTARGAEPYALFGGSLPRLGDLLNKAGSTKVYTQSLPVLAVYSGLEIPPEEDGLETLHGLPDSYTFGEEFGLSDGRGKIRQASKKENYTLIASINVPAGHRLSLIGSITANASDTRRRGMTEATATATLRRKGSSWQTQLGYAYATDLSDGGQAQYNVGYHSSTLTAGEYEVVLDIDLTVTNNQHSTASVQASGFRAEISNTTDYHFTAFGEDGLGAVFGEDRYLYLGTTEESFVKAKGAWDISGVLLSGTCTSDGQIERLYNPRPRTRPVSATPSSNDITITHNIGHTDYSVSLTPVYEGYGSEEQPFIMMVRERTTQYVRIVCWRQVRNTTIAKMCDFDFVFTGRN